MLPIVLMRGVNGWMLKESFMKVSKAQWNVGSTRKALGPKPISHIMNTLAFVASQNKQGEIWNVDCAR